MAGRVKGFSRWRPQRRTLPILSDIEAVLEEYAEYLPLTIRTIFYRVVSRGYPKTETFYNSVQEVCNRARRCRRIDFDAIRDDGFSRQGGEWFSIYQTPEDYYRTHDELYNHYRRSWHADQPAYARVLCEASGMVPMLERAVEDYRVEVSSSSGFDSLTVKHDLFQDALRRDEEQGQSTILLHAGDHDPPRGKAHGQPVEGVPGARPRPGGAVGGDPPGHAVADCPASRRKRPRPRRARRISGARMARVPAGTEEARRGKRGAARSVRAGRMRRGDMRETDCASGA
jgi:hypothetical protein